MTMTNEDRTDKTMMQRRIKNQRRQLRQMGRQLAYQQALVAKFRLSGRSSQSNWMRHAAEIAGEYWFASNAAKAIRRWV